jgi:adenine phosphoribosyltransferase
LLKDATGLQLAVKSLADHFRGRPIERVAGIEARGFILGAAVAYELGLGFIPVRKKGKLPAETVGQDYALEYGTDRIEIHTDAISPGESILLIDDLIATGGTAAAACALIQSMGGNVQGCGFVIDLPDLGGRQLLEQLGHSVFSLCEFEGD